MEVDFSSNRLVEAEWTETQLGFNTLLLLLVCGHLPIFVTEWIFSKERLLLESAFDHSKI
jgi:hypothetical protein